MRKSATLLLFALYSFSAAEAMISPSDPRNLEKLKVCIGDFQIRSGDILKDDDQRLFSKSQYELLKTKLTIYRIPYEENCKTLNHRLRVNITGSEPIGTQSAREYTVELMIFATDAANYKGEVLIYLKTISGVNVNYTDFDQRKEYVSALTSVIDRFAADYVKGNP